MGNPESENLPSLDVTRPSFAGYGKDLEAELVPGSWWRVADPEHDLAKKGILGDRPEPGHGIILLVSDVHIVDGEIHSVSLHPHPLWSKSYGVKILRDEFLRVMSPCPEGETLRALELAEMMGEVQRIGSSMSDIPDDDTLLSSVKAPEVKEGDGLASGHKLPAALLPSRDIVATQSRLERGIALLEARSAWVKARTAEMQASMRIVQTYQEKKVAHSLAGISTQRKQAEGLLKNVHTMRLFLGEGIDDVQLCDGKSADPSEPLHLMQRMLYLDEEIALSSVLDAGFHSGNMKNLSSILSNNPGIVNRMLPHPRSVVITRIRRNSRDFGPARNLLEALDIVEKDQQDKAIQILIRDGDRVHMVIADEETSGAERLFPSHQEIDKIFTERGSYDWEKRETRIREITPFDIEYAEKRSEHDRRALFYKRFLIMFWGLQERKGLFGPFIPEGVNWLEEATHNRYFRFVHDEENLLGDDLPRVETWIREMNDWIRPGSRILVKGRAAMTPDTAPTAVSYHNGHLSQDRYPCNDFDVLPALKRGRDVIVSLPTVKGWGDKTVNTPVSVRDSRGQPVTRGVLCLDRADPAMIRRFIESRRERESYLGWLHLLMEALPHAEARVAAENRDVARVNAAHPHVSGDMRHAVPLAVQALRDGKAPEFDVDPEKAFRLARTIAKALSARHEGEHIRVRSNGSLVRIERDFDPDAKSLSMPVLRQTDLKSGSSRIISFSHLPEIGETAIMGGISREESLKARSLAIPGLESPDDFEALRRLTSPEHAGVVADYIERSIRVDEEFIRNNLEKVIHHNHSSSSKMVQIPRQVMPFGIIRIDHSEKEVVAYLMRLTFDPTIHAARAGKTDLLKEMCRRVYSNPTRGYEILTDRAGKYPSMAFEYLPLRPEDALAMRLGDTTGEFTAESWRHLDLSPVTENWEYLSHGPRRQICVPADIVRAMSLRTREGSSGFWSKIDKGWEADAFVGAHGVREMIEQVMGKGIEGNEMVLEI